MVEKLEKNYGNFVLMLQKYEVYKIVYYLSKRKLTAEQIECLTMVRKSMTQHDTCQWPPKQPCSYDPRPGVRCAPIKEEYRLEHDLPQKPDFAVDHKEPIVVEWPPKVPHIGQGDCCEQDTGIREDLLCKIPEQIIPQIVTVHGTPAPLPGQTQSPVEHGKLNHPLCPDGQFHMEITPPQPVKPEIRIPDLGCAVRQPVRPWRQCIENTLINDRVRRPMARWCHKRPLPPLVIPTSELQRLKDKCTEPERKAKEKEDRVRQRECQRLESRRRMAKWNYTVESLLDRKREKEECKERAERESLQQLMKDIKQGKDMYSEEQLARAKKLQLYGKGLIKDFHAAMAFSKMIQDIERSREKVMNDKEEEMEKTLPICDQKCMKRMMYENDRPEYEKRGDKPKRINEKLLKTLQSIETRQQEQKAEVDGKIREVKQMLMDNLPELPPAYLKSIQEKPCEEISSTEKFLHRREQFYEEIDDKLAVDAYMEAHEKEVERQACEYAKYKLHKDLIRKQTEERLIKEKVQRNIEKSEAAARVLVEMRKQKQKENAHDYDSLKEKWEQEIQDKEDDKKERHQKMMDKVIRDFLERKGVEKCKWQLRDNSRLWARERLVAVENYEQECVRKNLRRQQAEEIQLYNLSLAAEKKCQQEREKMFDNAWAEKIKSQYFEEMQEMKDYAQDCIRDWTGKGRSSIPMHMAMKKWEWDSQMDPRMFRNYEEKKRRESGEDERGGGDADGFALLKNPQNYVKKSIVSSETTQDTSRRLGFC